MVIGITFGDMAAWIPESLGFLFTLGLLAVPAAIIASLLNRKAAAYWQSLTRLCDNLGWEVTLETPEETSSISMSRPWCLTGTIDGCRVEISPSGEPGRRLIELAGVVPSLSESMLVRVFPPQGQLSRLCCKGEGILEFGLQTGAPDFDSKIRVSVADATDGIESPGLGEDEVRARLNATTRHEIERFIMNHSGEINSGVLSYTDDHLLIDLERLNTVVQAMVRVQKSVFQPGFEIREALVANAKHDSEPVVRFRNFKVLADAYKSSPETLQTAHYLLQDSAIKNRLLAAVTVGSEAQTVLQKDWQGLKAMDHVTAMGDGDQALADYGELMLDALVGVAFDGREDALRELMLLALQMRDRYANTETGQAFQRVAQQLSIRSIGALGEVGTAASVEALLEHSTGFLTGGVKEAATSAIAKIQSRVKGAGVGQLMLSTADLNDVGHLELANRDGELALSASEDDRQRN